MIAWECLWACGVRIEWMAVFSQIVCNGISWKEIRILNCVSVLLQRHEYLRKSRALPIPTFISQKTFSFQLSFSQKLPLLLFLTSFEKNLQKSKQRERGPILQTVYFSVLNYLTWRNSGLFARWHMFKCVYAVRVEQCMGTHLYYVLEKQTCGFTGYYSR